MIPKVILAVAGGMLIGGLVSLVARRLGGSCPLTCRTKPGILLGAVVGLVLGIAWAGGRSTHTSLAGEEEFKQMVLASAQPVMVDFYADWCGPCRVLAPTIESLRQQYEGRATVVKVDTDRLASLARDYNIQALPTVVFFVNGQPVARLTGVRAAQEYQEVLDSLLAGGEAASKGVEP